MLFTSTSLSLSIYLRLHPTFFELLLCSALHVTRAVWLALFLCSHSLFALQTELTTHSVASCAGWSLWGRCSEGCWKPWLTHCPYLVLWPWNYSVLVVASIAEAPKRVSCCCQLQIKIQSIQKMLLCFPGMLLSLIISNETNGTALWSLKLI